MIEQIRAVLRDFANLSVNSDRLEIDSDLYAAGMTSHAVVEMMVALEHRFNLEIPDRLLTRNSFQSIAAIQDALAKSTPF